MTSENMMTFGNIVDYLHVSSRGNATMPCYAMVCQLAREMQLREEEPVLALMTKL